MNFDNLYDPYRSDYGNTSDAQYESGTTREKRLLKEI